MVGRKDKVQGFWLLRVLKLLGRVVKLQTKKKEKADSCQRSETNTGLHNSRAELPNVSQMKSVK
jgi:hypothetical protein